MWHDVDFENQAIFVKRQYSAGEEGREMQEVKTKGSRRRISIGPNTCEMLREHRRRLNIEKQGTARWEEHDAVFPSTVGTPLYPSNVRRNFWSVLEEAGLPRIRFHDLRHTTASVWL